MIFNEIEYQNLFAEKFKKISLKLQEKFKEDNNTELIFTPLSVEAQQKAVELSQNLIKEEDIPEHIQAEFEKYESERVDMVNKILNGGVKLPLVTEEDLKEVTITVEEIIKHCTHSVEDFISTIKEKQNG